MSRLLPTTLSAAAAAAALACAAADAAHAGTVSRPYVGSDTLTFTAAPGETNRLTIDELAGGDTVIIRDAVPLRSGTPDINLCDDRGAFGLACPARHIAVQLGDRNDTLVANTSKTVTALAGAGDDRYEYANEARPSRVLWFGEAGTDTADYSAAPGPVEVRLDDGLLPNGSPAGGDGLPGDKDAIRHGTERLIGSRFDDVLVAHRLGTLLAGGQGNDRLQGSAGPDFFDAGPAADGADTIVADSEDTVSYARRTNKVTLMVGDTQSNDGEAGEGDSINEAARIEGGRGNDRITIGANQGTLRAEVFGGPGNDTLEGGAGNDLIHGGPGRDLMFGRDGNDSHQARDGEADIVSCGGSPQDFAFIDAGIESRVIGCIQLITEVGRLRISPKQQTVERGGRAEIAVGWKHPVAWRRLRTLEVALRDDERVVARRRLPVTAGRGGWARVAVRMRVPVSGRLSVDVTAVDRRGRSQRELDAAHLNVTP